MGHATRCVSLINRLKQLNTVVIGVTPSTEGVFNEHFPELKKVYIEPYHIKYSTKLSVTLKLLFDSYRIFKVIKKENNQLKQIVKENNINLIISDNRFGLYHKDVESIYITHQLNIQANYFSNIANYIHSNYIKKFHKIWVPDYENETHCLAGDLSRNTRYKNVEYIGPLSRLEKLDEIIKFDYLFLLSGPEPLRTQFEKQLIELSKTTQKNIALVRGSSLKTEFMYNSNLVIFDMPNERVLSRLILGAEHVFCRSGYSTLMDLHLLNKHEITLIPTPGQYEQEYLANYWKNKFGARVVIQNNLSKIKL